MTSTRSSDLPHLVGLSGPTNLRLNRMDLPCSRCSPWLHAGGTNPGSTSGHSHSYAACNSAFPLERQGRLLRSRSISGLFSRSLHSGLRPPCLRFAVAVTGHHARLGTRLLARLCRGRHLRRQSSTRLQGATLSIPIRTGTKLGTGGLAAAASCRRQAVSSPRATPLRRATSEMLTPSSKLSATIRAFCSADHRRRRRSPVITSIRRYESPSCLASSMASAIAHLQRSVHATLYRRQFSRSRGGHLMPVTIIWPLCA